MRYLAEIESEFYTHTHTHRIIKEKPIKMCVHSRGEKKLPTAVVRMHVVYRMNFYLMLLAAPPQCLFFYSYIFTCARTLWASARVHRSLCAKVYNRVYNVFYTTYTLYIDVAVRCVYSVVWCGDGWRRLCDAVLIKHKRLWWCCVCAERYFMYAQCREPNNT